MKLESIVKEYKLSGALEIDIPQVVKLWNHLWYIAEWRGDNGNWRLIKYVRKDSPSTEFKVTISFETANLLINKLNLISENAGLRSAFSWRKQKDIDALEKWRYIKHSKK